MRGWAVAAILALALAADGAIAQAPVERIEIAMSNFKFSPARIHLHRGTRYQLAFRNESGGGHSLKAGPFFAAADMPAQDRARLRNGEIEVLGGEQVSVSVVPNTPGTYRFHCTHPLHGLLGMTGSIVVD